MKAWRCVIGLALVLAGLTPAWGADSVVVVSRECYAGAHGVVIGIRVVNDESVCGLVVPLQIKAVTQGSFITSLKLSYGGRLSGPLSGVVVGVQHAVKDSVCSSGDSAAYGDISFDGVGVSHPVGASPEGAMFVRTRWSAGDLQPGADVTPSMYLTVDVTSTLGTFEIDTTCMVPNNHLMFAKNCPDATPEIPKFKKGVVTIAACDCPNQGDLAQNGFIDINDVLQLIRIAFSNGTDIQDPTCPKTRANVNNTGVVNSSDVSYIQNYVFNNGPNPVDPCGP